MRNPGVRVNSLSKRVCLSLLLLCLASVAKTSFVSADMDADRAAAFDQRMAETKQRLDLTDEQVEQLTPILKAQAQSMTTTLKKYGIDPESGKRPDKKLGREGARSLGKDLDLVRADTHQKLEGILSAEQLDGFKKIQKERKKETRERARSKR